MLFLSKQVGVVILVACLGALDLVQCFELPTSCTPPFDGVTRKPPHPPVSDTPPPSLPTYSPTVASSSPTAVTSAPTVPTHSPTVGTHSPTVDTHSPTIASISPTVASIAPTDAPTTASPTIAPTTDSPTAVPSTAAPTQPPTSQPTPTPTEYWEAQCCRDLRSQYHSDVCSLHSGKITALDFHDLHLTGTIPAQIQYFTDLVYLNLSVNELSGAIPDFFNIMYILPNLQKLRLNNNELSDNVPFNIFQFPSLNLLDVSNNRNLILDFKKINYTLPQSQQTFQIDTAKFDFMEIYDSGGSPHIYRFFDRISFNDLSITYSYNHFTMDWDENNNDVSIYAVSLNLSQNNITGMYPCSFRHKQGVSLDLRGNIITGTSIDCYASMGYHELFITQDSRIYNSFSYDECLSDFSSWATSTDWLEYCSFMSFCGWCDKKTPAPTVPNETSGDSSLDVLLKWGVPVVAVVALIVVFLLCRMIRKKKNEKRMHPKMYREITAGNQLTKKGKNTLTELNEKDSLLYGDF